MRFIQFYADKEETTYVYNADEISSIHKVKEDNTIYIQFKSGKVNNYEFTDCKAAFYTLENILKQLGVK